MYDEFKKVWDVRKLHLVAELPTQYIFLLCCYYQTDCPHPICQRGRQVTSPRWYSHGLTIDFFPLPAPDSSSPWGDSNCSDCKGPWYSHGLTIDFFPLPAPDSSRPWDDSNCSDCKGPCSGHFFKPVDDLQNIREATNRMVKPPSVVNKEFLLSRNRVKQISKHCIAKSVLLSEQEVKIWIDHLNTVSENLE